MDKPWYEKISEKTLHSAGKKLEILNEIPPEMLDPDDVDMMKDCCDIILKIALIKKEMK